ncbi:MAG TPA: phosphatase PAP2 family protein [Gemmatimonadales bacterium]|jgi:membrane-associated phospholipid phosphatase|nr:phosphatase PAP2 family protein [Gemmatimonadales bacterium]
MVSGRRLALAVRPAAGEHAPRSRPRLDAVDLVLLGYLAVVTAVAVHRAPGQPECWWVASANVLAAVLIVLLTRPGQGRTSRAIREIYPLLLLPVLYGELDVINRAGAAVHDAIVQHWELALFGTQVSREWWQAAPSVLWSTVFHAAYFSYYFVVSVPAFWFLARGNLPAVRRFVLAVMTTFVVCYLVFVFFPVAGPYYAFPHPAAWFLDNPAARLVYRTLERGSSYGAAFPSSHVAATVAAAIAAAQGSRRLGLILLVPTVLLTVGVVYCQMHYAVDALAGLAVGTVVALGVGSLAGG